MKTTQPLEIQGWLTNMRNGFEGGTCYSPKFLKPYHLITLATELKRYTEKQLTIPQPLANYAERMGLWQAIDLPSPRQTARSSAKQKFLPIEQLRSANNVENNSAKLTTILKPYCSDDATVRSIDFMLLELLDNCFDHAAVKHDLHGLVCCQPWPKGKLAQIALVDSGIGIRASLSANRTLDIRLNGENCCELATEPGITSKPHEKHTGLGLALARGLIEQNGGNLIIISGSEIFQINNGKRYRGYIDIAWHGTIIILEINTDQPLNSTKVFRGWSLPAGFTVDDFDFVD